MSLSEITIWSCIKAWFDDESFVCLYSWQTTQKCTKKTPIHPHCSGEDLLTARSLLRIYPIWSPHPRKGKRNWLANFVNCAAEIIEVITEVARLEIHPMTLKGVVIAGERQTRELVRLLKSGDKMWVLSIKIPTSHLLLLTYMSGLGVQVIHSYDLGETAWISLRFGRAGYIFVLGMYLREHGVLTHNL